MSERITHFTQKSEAFSPPVSTAECPAVPLHRHCRAALPSALPSHGGNPCVPVRAAGMAGCPKSLALMCVAMPTGIVPICATVSQPARESRPISSTDLPLLLTDGRESVDSSERRRDRFVLEVLLRRTQLEQDTHDAFRQKAREAQTSRQVGCRSGHAGLCSVGRWVCHFRHVSIAVWSGRGGGGATWSSSSTSSADVRIESSVLCSSSFATYLQAQRLL